MKKHRHLLSAPGLTVHKEFESQDVYGKKLLCVVVEGPEQQLDELDETLLEKTTAYGAMVRFKTLQAAIESDYEEVI